MKTVRKFFLLILIFIFALGTVSTNAGKTTDNSNKSLTTEGRKWRIGYCETEPFSNYAQTLYYILQGMGEYGSIKNADQVPYTQGQDDTTEIWKWISTHDMGEYIEFPQDAYFTLSKIQTEKGKNPEDTVIERLQKKDLDLVIVMGTKAGQALSNDKHNIPVFVFSSSNAYKSGIVNGIDYSDNSHVWAHMDINRFKRQLQVFNDIFKYKKLGVVYENSDIGKSYASLDDIESVAKERGFEIVPEYVNEPKDANDMARYQADLKKAYSRLASKVDAFYITTASIDAKWLPELLQPFYDKKIPVFSQLGADEVSHGALMSITLFDFPNMGRFGADTIINALKGKPVNKLEQIYPNNPQIILNLETAKKIGYKPAFDILLSADKVYGSIQK